MNHKHLVKSKRGQGENDITLLPLRRGRSRWTTKINLKKKKIGKRRVYNFCMVERSLFDVSELFEVLGFCEVRVVCQQVNHIGHHVLRQEGQELLCRRRGRMRGTCLFVFVCFILMVNVNS